MDVETQELNKLQGKWFGKSESGDVSELEIIEKSVKSPNENEVDQSLFWRPDLVKWVIGGLSITILTIYGEALHLYSPNKVTGDLVGIFYRST